MRHREQVGHATDHQLLVLVQARVCERVKDMDEAVAWAKRCPNPMPGPSELEIRPFYEMEDFGDAVTPEIGERDQRLRDQLPPKGT